MKAQLKHLYLVTRFALVLCTIFSCDKHETIPNPAITDFSPTAAIEGSAVTINGSNFGSTATTNTVKFNGVTSTISATSKSSITAIVPPGATTGKISVTANGKTGTSSTDFTVLLPITGFSPASGRVGTSVTISGNFDPTPSNNIVKFNGTSAAVLNASATSLTVTVPSGATTGKISVQISGSTTFNSASDFLVISPSITGFSPSSGAVGTSVTISGANFDPTPLNNTVKFNGTSATVLSATATSLTVTVPLGATTGKISVQINGDTFTSVADFTVNYPSITGFSPAGGTPGTTVSISGTNFDPIPANNSVKFNGTSAAVVSASATSLNVTVPAGATTGKISVLINVSTATSTSDFTLLHPTITGFSPSSGVAGTSIAITGQDFDTGLVGLDTVKFNGEKATVTSITSTQLIVTVPQHASSGTISLTIGGTTVISSNSFTILVPTITDFSPASGTVGTSVVITGTNFSTNPAYNMVTFNGEAASVTSSSSTQVVVSVPQYATSGTISINTGANTATSASGFTILAPTITSFTPTIGSAGVAVVITGTNFSPYAFNSVKFNGVTATVTNSTSTQITATAPAGVTTGKIGVTVGANTATSVDDFTVCNGVQLLLSNVNVSSISYDRTQALYTYDVTNVGASAATLTYSTVGVQAYFSVDAVYDGSDLPAGGHGIQATINSGQTYPSGPPYTAGNGSATVDNYPYLILKLNSAPSFSECDKTIDHIVILRMIP